jgi:hypothetical protein
MSGPAGRRDPQATSTSSLGAEPNGLRTSLYDADQAARPDNIIPTTHEGLHLLPSAPALAGAEGMVSILEAEHCCPAMDQFWAVTARPDGAPSLEAHRQFAFQPIA